MSLCLSCTFGRVPLLKPVRPLEVLIPDDEELSTDSTGATLSVLPAREPGADTGCASRDASPVELCEVSTTCFAFKSLAVSLEQYIPCEVAHFALFIKT